MGFPVVLYWPERHRNLPHMSVRTCKAAHKAMTISDVKSMAGVGDVMAVLTKAGVGDAEKAGELLYIFYSLKPMIFGV